MEISQLISEVQKNLRRQILFNATDKAPEALSSMSESDLRKTLTDVYSEHVWIRDMPVVRFSDSEIGEKIEKTITWIKTSSHHFSLMLQGTLGNGKTTLAHTLYCIYRTVAPSSYFCTAYSFFEQYVRNERDEENLFREYLNCRYLFLDDLGAEPSRCLIYGTEHTPLQRLIDHRYTRRLPTIITTNYSDDMIADRYGIRCADRLKEMCAVLRFSAASYRK